jgi:hypothetical protein
LHRVLLRTEVEVYRRDVRSQAFCEIHGISMLSGRGDLSVDVTTCDGARRPMHVRD